MPELNSAPPVDAPRGAEPYITQLLGAAIGTVRAGITLEEGAQWKISIAVGDPVSVYTISVTRDETSRPSIELPGGHL